MARSESDECWSGEADSRWQGKDDGGKDPRHHTDTERRADRYQVNKGRHGLRQSPVGA